MSNPDLHSPLMLAVGRGSQRTFTYAPLGRCRNGCSIQPCQLPGQLPRVPCSLTVTWPLEAISKPTLTVRETEL
jgi:hypothetical protein